MEQIQIIMMVDYMTKQVNFVLDIIHQVTQKTSKIRKRKIRGNSGYDKIFLHKIHIQEYWLTIYIDSKYEPPYIELTRNTKGVILPQYGQRKVTKYSYEHVHFLVKKYFSDKQKVIQHLHMLTHGEYI